MLLTIKPFVRGAFETFFSGGLYRRINLSLWLVLVVFLLIILTSIFVVLRFWLCSLRSVVFGLILVVLVALVLSPSASTALIIFFSRVTSSRLGL